MFRVAANSLEDFFAFDPARTAELDKLHVLMRKAAPNGISMRERRWIVAPVSLS
jgi:hypothetical protein